MLNIRIYYKSSGYHDIYIYRIYAFLKKERVEVKVKKIKKERVRVKYKKKKRREVVTLSVGIINFIDPLKHDLSFPCHHIWRFCPIKEPN